MWDLTLPLAGASQAPRIDSFAPAVITAGPSPLTVTVSGSNFMARSAVRWNGLDRPAAFVSATTLRFTLSAEDLARSGRNTLLVFNPVAGGGLSNAMNVPVGPAPGATTNGITSAADAASPRPLVPGSIASLLGSNLASDTVSAGAPPLPYTLGGVTIEINGWPATMFYVSPTQINFQVPWELEGHGSATLTILNGTLSSSLQVSIGFAAPALFTTDGSGKGQGAVTIAGPEVLAAPGGAFPGSRPARRGEFLQIYGTGFGPVSRIQSDGQPKSPATLAISRTPEVTIGGVPANVQFAGLTAGGVGLYQINVQVPAGAPAGAAVPVVVTLSRAASNPVTVAVE